MNSDAASSESQRQSSSWCLWMMTVNEPVFKSSKTRLALDWLSVEIKPEIGYIVEILFWPVHVKEHVRIIGQNRKIRSHPRKFAWINRFWNFEPQNFPSVASVTWIVGSSKFRYEYDRISVFFHSMDSDFQISLLVARESKMDDFWRNLVERHQMTVLIWFSQNTHKLT